MKWVHFGNSHQRNGESNLIKAIVPWAQPSYQEWNNASIPINPTFEFEQGSATGKSCTLHPAPERAYPKTIWNTDNTEGQTEHENESTRTEEARKDRCTNDDRRVSRNYFSVAKVQSIKANNELEIVYKVVIRESRFWNCVNWWHLLYEHSWYAPYALMVGDGCGCEQVVHYTTNYCWRWWSVVFCLWECHLPLRSTNSSCCCGKCIKGEEQCWLLQLAVITPNATCSQWLKPLLAARGTTISLWWPWQRGYPENTAHEFLWWVGTSWEQFSARCSPLSTASTEIIEHLSTRRKAWSIYIIFRSVTVTTGHITCHPF